LLQVQAFFEHHLGITFFDQKTTLAIAEKYSYEKGKVSKLQKLVADSLPKRESSSISHEYPLYKIVEKVVDGIRNVDIHFFSTPKEGTSVEYFIEVDGPDHYSYSDKTNPRESLATRNRDFLNKKMIARSGTLSECHYLTLSFKEIEENQANLKDFLVSKMEGSDRIDPENQVHLFKESREEIEKTAISLGKLSIENPSQKFAASASASKSLLGEVSESSLVLPPPLSKKLAKQKTSSLERAIREGNVQDVMAVIASGRETVEGLLPNVALSPFAFAIQCAQQTEFGVNDAGSMKIFNALVSAGADVTSYLVVAPPAVEGKKKKGKSAATRNSLQEIFENSFNPDYESLCCSLIKHDSIALHENSLTAAVRSGSLKIVEAVLEKGFDPNNEESKGALNLAVQKFLEKDRKESDTLILESLLCKGLISPKSINFAVKKEVKFAVKKKVKFAGKFAVKKEELFIKSLDAGSPKIFLKLFEAEDSKQNFLTEETSLIKCLMSAVCLGFEDVTRVILDSNPSFVNIRFWSDNDPPFFPLVAAASLGQAGVVRLLVERGADVNAESGSLGYTSLHYASQNNYPEVAKILVEAPTIKVDALDAQCNNTPLSLACIKGSAGVAKELVEHGAKINQKDSIGNTPLVSAAQANHLEVIEVLTAREDLEMEEKVMNGNTALCCASNFGHAGAVKLLLEKGAKVNHQNDYGCTALMYASEHGFFEVTEAILKHKDCVVDLKTITAYSGGSTALLIASCNDGRAPVGEVRKKMSVMKK